MHWSDNCRFRTIDIRGLPFQKIHLVQVPILSQRTSCYTIYAKRENWSWFISAQIGNISQLLSLLKYKSKVSFTFYYVRYRRSCKVKLSMNKQLVILRCWYSLASKFFKLTSWIWFWMKFQNYIHVIDWVICLSIFWYHTLWKSLEMV